MYGEIGDAVKKGRWVDWGVGRRELWDLGEKGDGMGVYAGVLCGCYGLEVEGYQTSSVCLLTSFLQSLAAVHSQSSDLPSHSRTHHALTAPIHLQARHHTVTNSKQ